MPETWRGAVVLVRGYRSRLGPTLRAAEGQEARSKRDAAARVRGCSWRALGAPSARPPTARRNAMAPQRAWMILQVTRLVRVVTKPLVDKLARQVKQLYNAN